MSVEPLSSLDRSTLRERSLAALRTAITSGRYRPGDHLGEVELATHLGVSRGTVTRWCVCTDASTTLVRTATRIELSGGASSSPSRTRSSLPTTSRSRSASEGEILARTVWPTGACSTGTTWYE